jgi:phosphoenolpyruvate carboxylase
MPVKAKTMLQKIIEIVAQNPGLSRPELAHKVVEKYPNMYFGSVNSSLSYLHNRGKINVPAIKHFQYNSNNS